MMNTDWTASLSPSVAQKTQACCAILREIKPVVVAFSAGVDSSLLLALAAETLGPAGVLAAIGVSPSLPQRELEEGRQLAAKIGVELVEVPTGELDDAQYAQNPSNRCYFCKGDLFRRLLQLGKERGFASVVSGANADDTGDFRPGLQAGKELGVRNPLLEAGLTKVEVRELSRLLGLPTADKPAMACLASRIPYGQTITAERLGRVEQAEYALKDMGFRTCRVRDHHPVARVELEAKDFASAIEYRDAIVKTLKALGYVFVTLDLQGLRTGAMNEMLRIKQ